MIILGIVEGVTEFLPISSTGHLIVVSSLLDSSTSDATFEIVIQLGAVVAVALYYRRHFIGLLADARTDPDARRFWRNLVLASIPAMALGFMLGDFIATHLFSPRVVAFALIGGGVVLWLVDRRLVRSTSEDGPEPHGRRGLETLSATQAILIGCAQTVALVPGVSRAAASIVGGLLVGLDRPSATAFSFFLAIPTLGAAGVYSLARNLDFGSVADLPLLALGTLIAFGTALIVIRALLRFIEHYDFRPFAVYRIALGAALLMLAPT